MEEFVRKHMPCLASLWDQIWIHEGVPGTVIVNPTSAHVVTVLYDFQARNDEELTVYAGETVYLSRHEGDYVWVSKVTGAPRKGLVPTTYVSFSTHESFSEQWFADGVSRLEAERLLLSPPNIHGSYLVRPSESCPGQYTLSVRHETRVTHFRILKNHTGEFYLEKAQTFPTMQNLIAFYKTNWRQVQGPLLQPFVRKVSSPAAPSIQPISILPSAPEFEIDAWERPRAEFVLLSMLGEGFFGEVWEGLWLDEYSVAIKTMKQADMKKDELIKEISALKVLHHPNLIELCAICTVGEPVYIVTELMKNGNLQSYLSNCDKRTVSQRDLMCFACHVAQGMAYLEEMHIIHRDLAARNVLVGDDLICKIADFGLARLLKDDIYNPSCNIKIPVKWTAPEAANYQQYSMKSDVWSYGVLLYEIFTYGQPPYKGMNNREAMEQITNGYRLPRPEICPADVYSLMWECWRDLPLLRPTFQDLKEKLASVLAHM